MKLHIVLFNPAIILNVGNIARTCYAFNAELHLIRPYGFIFDQSKLKRSSTNHFDLIKLHQYDNWNEFCDLNNTNSHYYFFSRWGNLNPHQIDVNSIITKNTNANIYLIFGNENSGIDKNILNQYPNNIVRIPINQDLVCINVANAVAIGCYEIYRQIDFNNLHKTGK